VSRRLALADEREMIADLRDARVEAEREVGR
jgi:hypothetical protein